jgi:transcriptional regulator with XRE-family HTH domain
MITKAALALRNCGLSAEEIETKCGITRQLLRKWQRGISQPKSRQKLALSKWIPLLMWDQEVTDPPEQEPWPKTPAFMHNYSKPGGRTDGQ